MNVIENIGKVTFDPHQWKVIIEGYRNIFLLLVIGFIWHFFPAKWNLFLKNSFEKTPLIGKALILAFVFWIVYATASTGPQPFIYFQF